MEFIDMNNLRERLPHLKQQFQAQKPFRFVMFDHFFKAEKAEQILREYPVPNNDTWNGTTYIDQKNKFVKNNFQFLPLFQQVFNELNAPEFLAWLEELTNIEEPLLADPSLFGAGLHQSMNGAFLNVHVDYNIHPETKFHRRLNVLVYMNPNWKEEYNGHIELWDLTGKARQQLGRFSPGFNRCVIFETNEISFHGHPKKLNTPEGVSRKSLATYYYTKNRPTHETAAEHNTIFVNLEGLPGRVKQLSSGVKAFLERINKK